MESEARLATYPGILPDRTYARLGRVKFAITIILTDRGKSSHVFRLVCIGVGRKIPTAGGEINHLFALKILGNSDSINFQTEFSRLSKTIRL